MAPLLDTEQILTKDQTLVASLSFVERLPGVRGVSKGKWVRLPQSRLRGGTLVPLGTDANGTLVGKLYTKKPDTGYIPLTIYTQPKTDPERISQLIAARNFEEAEKAKTTVDNGPDPAIAAKWANRPKVEIAQPSQKAAKQFNAPEVECPPSVSVTIPPLHTKTVLAPRNGVSANDSATTTPPLSMRKRLRGEVPAGMVDLNGAMKILDLGSKSSVSYHVKMGHLVPAVKGNKGLSNLYRIEDVEALKATKARVGAPPGGHQQRALHTVEDKLDAMLAALSQIALIQNQLLERWT